MAKLTEEEFKATMGKAVAVGSDERPPFDFWTYFEIIPVADFAGHDCSEGNVDHAWRDEGGRWEHVLVSSEHRNVFMVLVLDLVANTVHGHHLLDLNELYGLEDPNE